jgi:hypothetical protein
MNSYPGLELPTNQLDRGMVACVIFSGIKVACVITKPFTAPFALQPKKK